MLIPLRNTKFQNVVSYIKSSCITKYTIYKEGRPTDEVPNYGVSVDYKDIAEQTSTKDIVAFEHVFKDPAMTKDLAAIRNWILLIDVPINPFGAEPS